MNSLPCNHGKYWPIEEDEVLCQENIMAMPVKEIARIHQRTQNAIKLRLLHIAKRLLKEHKTEEEIVNKTGLPNIIIRDIARKNIFQEILDCLLRIEDHLKINY